MKMPNRFFGQNFQKISTTEFGLHQRQILHVRNSLGTKFQVKLTILKFWSKITQKEHFRSKKEEKNLHV